MQEKIRNEGPRAQRAGEGLPDIRQRFGRGAECGGAEGRPLKAGGDDEAVRSIVAGVYGGQRPRRLYQFPIILSHHDTEMISLY